MHSFVSELFMGSFSKSYRNAYDNKIIRVHVEERQSSNLSTKYLLVSHFYDYTDYGYFFECKTKHEVIAETFQGVCLEDLANYIVQKMQYIEWDFQFLKPKIEYIVLHLIEVYKRKKKKVDKFFTKVNFWYKIRTDIINQENYALLKSEIEYLFFNMIENSIAILLVRDDDSLDRYQRECIEKWSDDNLFQYKKGNQWDIVRSIDEVLNLMRNSLNIGHKTIMLDTWNKQILPRINQSRRLRKSEKSKRNFDI